MKNVNIDGTIPKEVITYAAALCEAKLAEVARNTNQPEQELREWVAIFLLSSWTGISNYMPTLRRETTKVYPSARKMALANNSHPKSQKKPSDSSYSVKLQGFKAKSARGFKYNGKHWTQLPKNKARLKEQVRKMHLAKGHIVGVKSAKAA